MTHPHSRPLAACLFAIGLFAALPAQAGFEEGNAAWQEGKYDVALKEFTAAARRGDADASFRLGTMYAKGEGTPRNLYLAWQYFYQAVERGNLTAVAELGDLSDYFDLYLFSPDVPAPGKRGGAVKRLQNAAKKGSSNALNDLALIYKQGDGVKQDMQKALEYINRAAEKKNPFALTNLGLMYGRGDGVQADSARAVALYQEAVALGHPRAHTLLAQRLMDGDGIKRDVKTAVQYYRQAAEKGDVRAQLALADLLRRGVNKIVPVDSDQAVYWYEKAAQAGNLDAQMVLADMFESGQEVAGDPQRAARWYEAAATRNHSAEARYRLASLYDTGLGNLKADPKAAARWYLEGAKNNDAQAQQRLAELYATGRGVQRDAEEAGRWLARAAAGCCGQPPLSKMVEKSPALTGLPAAEKLRLFRRAARDGNADAQTTLGRWYARGENGLPVDRNASRQWLERAARQNYAPAKAALRELSGEQKAGAGKKAAPAPTNAPQPARDEGRS